ncbi:MAG: 3-oxoacyl-[acyl-carrier protein] reductase [Microgenomates group bacterium Gr01-1014_7]|nr:MAG: 3-oxoacyl-[acyl-carrier protein] reductase [Microgenomates group bacterium Gr01-1014_7]
MKLKDKVVLVTGGSSGIGKAIVMAFANEGCNIVFTYNSKKKESEDIVKEVEQLGIKTLAVKVDMHSEEDIQKLFDQIKEKFKTLDILVNSAGINRPRDLFDLKVWREVFEINLFSVVLCTEKAVGLMENGGKILNVSSIYAEGKACWKGLPAYGASKAAISHFTQTLAKNLAPKILVNAIAPGYVKTPLWIDTTEEDFENSGKEQLIKRMIMPEEIAEMAVAIVKNDAMTGEVVVIDGGISLKTV